MSLLRRALVFVVLLARLASVCERDSGIMCRPSFSYRIAPFVALWSFMTQERFHHTICSSYPYYRMQTWWLFRTKLHFYRSAMCAHAVLVSGGPAPEGSRSASDRPLGECARDTASPRRRGRPPPTIRWTLQRLGGWQRFELSRSATDANDRQPPVPNPQVGHPPHLCPPPPSTPSPPPPPPPFPPPQRLPLSHTVSRSAPPPRRAVSHSFRPLALRAPRT